MNIGKMRTFLQQNSKRYYLQDKLTTVGSGPNSDIPTDSGEDQHALIENDVVNGVHWIRDLNTFSGTFINGRPIHSRTRLLLGDQIRFGYDESFVFAGEEPARPTVTMVNNRASYLPFDNDHQSNFPNIRNASPMSASNIQLVELDTEIIHPNPPISNRRVTSSRFRNRTIRANSLERPQRAMTQAWAQTIPSKPRYAYNNQNRGINIENSSNSSVEHQSISSSPGGRHQQVIRKLQRKIDMLQNTLASQNADSGISLTDSQDLTGYQQDVKANHQNLIDRIVNMQSELTGKDFEINKLKDELTKSVLDKRLQQQFLAEGDDEQNLQLQNLQSELARMRIKKNELEDQLYTTQEILRSREQTIVDMVKRNEEQAELGYSQQSMRKHQLALLLDDETDDIDDFGTKTSTELFDDLDKEQISTLKEEIDVLNSKLTAQECLIKSITESISAKIEVIVDSEETDILLMEEDILKTARSSYLGSTELSTSLGSADVVSHCVSEFSALLGEINQCLTNLYKSNKSYSTLESTVDQLNSAVSQWPNIKSEEEFEDWQKTMENVKETNVDMKLVRGISEILDYQKTVVATASKLFAKHDLFGAEGTRPNETENNFHKFHTDLVFNLMDANLTERDSYAVNEKEITRQLEVTKTELSSLEEQLEQLQTENEKMTEIIRIKEKELQEKEDEINKVREHNEEIIIELGKSNETISSKETEVNDFTSEVAVLKAQLEVDRASSGKLETEIKDQREYNRANEELLLSKNVELQKQVESQKEQLEVLTSAPNITVSVDNTDEINYLKEHIETLEEELRLKNADQNNMPFSDANTKPTNSDLYEQKIFDLEEKLTEIQVIKEQLKEENDALSSINRKLKDKVVDLEDSSVAEGEETDNLKQQLDERDENYQILNNKLKSTMEQLDFYKSKLEIDQLKISETDPETMPDYISNELISTDTSYWELSNKLADMLHVDLKRTVVPNKPVIDQPDQKWIAPEIISARQSDRKSAADEIASKVEMLLSKVQEQNNELSTNRDQNAPEFKLKDQSKLINTATIAEGMTSPQAKPILSSNEKRNIEKRALQIKNVTFNLP